MPDCKRILRLLLFVSVSARCSTVDIRLMSDIKPAAVICSIVSGKYVVYGDDRRITDTISAAVLEFQSGKDSVLVKTLEKKLGCYRKVSLVSIISASSFKLKSIAPATSIRIYDGDLQVSVEKEIMMLINHVDLEKYVAGVVEAESGTIAEDEFYKVQSILCRTYVLANKNKHLAEGFNLCDQVHCQVYRGKTKNPRIFFASNETHDLVVVDNDLKLISTTFCSNCGGQTVNSEDVWGKPSSSLKSVKDSFCLRMPHARWERHVSVEDWKNYLELKLKFPVNDSTSFSSALNNNQNGRMVYFTDKNLKIPLKVIRTDFQLKSTFFSVMQRNDSVIFNGRGYGHGVGLCQEGAMNMAKLGYSYKEILNFYYRNINIIDLDKMEFFKEED
jgi:stage II sporulation protein D